VNENLITAVRANNTDAFKQMYESYIRYVYSIVTLYVSNESDYQDVVQEIFALVFLKIDTYRAEKGEFKHWLRKLSVNQCIKHYNKSKLQIETAPLDLNQLNQLPADDNLHSLSRVDLIVLLKAMPNGYREVFMLVVIDDYSHKEVGELLNISPETSRSQLHRAKQWLHENLSRNTLNLLSSGIK
jgi:RNA polymerase sigma factor (sigma-70 family)